MSIAKALATLRKFEYSSDGFPKRYPEESDFVSAMAVLDPPPVSLLIPDQRARELLGLIAAFAPLFNYTSKVATRLVEADDGAWELRVGDFYKHGEVTIRVDASSGSRPMFRVIGRYGDLDEIETFEDLVRLNIAEWQRYECKGFNISPAWLPYMEQFGLIEKVETVSYKVKA